MSEIMPIEYETVDDTVKNRIFVTIDGNDVQFQQTELGIQFNMTESEIMERVVPVILEEKGVDISDSFKVRKMVNNENIFIIPNSVAGN